VEDTESIVEFWRIEESFTSWIASEILEERKTSTKELSIDTILTDFFVCNIWDLVKVYINTNNDIMNFNWALKVIEKNFTSWWINKITLKLNTWKVKSLNVKEFLQDLNTRVRNLEL
jgi:hypothetical protein